MPDDFEKRLNDFIEKLKKPKGLKTSKRKYQNPWENESKCNNLKRFLTKYKGAKYILIGEAPGRKGCFECGVPFCDINTFSQMLGIKSAPDKPKETSARRIYETEQFKKNKFVAWNAFPYHPCKSDKTNRHPLKDELEFGVKYLKDFLDLFDRKGKVVVLLGNVAAKVFNNLCDINPYYKKIEHIELIHPSPCADAKRREKYKSLSNFKGSDLWQEYVNLKLSEHKHP